MDCGWINDDREFPLSSGAALTPAPALVAGQNVDPGKLRDRAWWVVYRPANPQIRRVLNRATLPVGITIWRFGASSGAKGVPNHLPGFGCQESRIIFTRGAMGRQYLEVLTRCKCCKTSCEDNSASDEAWHPQPQFQRYEGEERDNC